MQSYINYQKYHLKDLYIDYISVDRLLRDPGIFSLDKDRDPGHPAWFLSTNNHSKLMMCHILIWSSSDMQKLG